MKKILITGASGFIGSFIVEEALQRGMEVWAAVRRTSSKRYLKDERIKFIELDFSSVTTLEEAMATYRWDYIVHAAGATKCLKKEDFFRINTEGTKHFAQAIMSLGIEPEKFIFMSSLSAYGAISEQYPYKNIKEEDEPKPNTSYGASKMQAEEFLDKYANRLHVVTLRPTGVYGPREKDYLMMVDSIRKHVDFAVGFRPQEITFVYVRDLVQAVFLALEKGVDGRKYFVSDGKVYSSKDFSELIKKELGNLFVFRIVAPIWMLWIVCKIGGFIGSITGKMSALNMDKFNILRQRNWRCDISPIVKDLDYNPKYDLERGVHEWLCQ